MQVSLSILVACSRQTLPSLTEETEEEEEEEEELREREAEKRRKYLLVKKKTTESSFEKGMRMKTRLMMH
jgi:hypothetical protein